MIDDQQRHEYERQLAALRGTAQALEDEVAVLRRRLQDAPRRVRILEERISETKAQLSQAAQQNEKHALRRTIHTCVVCPICRGVDSSPGED